MSDPHILPDSRSKSRRGAKLTRLGWMIPAFCANCGAEHGMVLERDITHCFVLCNKCEAWGNIAHFYKEPDHVYRERVAAEIAAAEEKAKLEAMPPLEALNHIARALEDPGSTISKLANEWQRRLRKEA